MELQLTQIWERILEVHPIGVQDRFFELGTHSLLAVRLVSEINRTLKVDLRLVTLLQNATIERLAKALQKQGSRKPDPVILSLRDGKQGLPLFFIQAASAQFRLADLLRTTQPVFGTDVPIASEVMEAAIRLDSTAVLTMEGMAAEHASLILNHQPPEPCLLAGFCFHGLLAFEIAHQLQRQGRKVEAILLFDVPLTKALLWRRFSVRLRTHARNTLQQGLGYLWRKVRTRLERERRKLALKRGLLLIPEPLLSYLDDAGDPPDWLILEIIFGHAMNFYRPKPLASRGILFLSQEGLRDFCELGTNTRAAKLFGEGFEIVEVPGKHGEMLQETHIRAVAQQVDCALERTRGISNPLKPKKSS